MPLARVKTWNAGDILTAADQNAEFNNILNNPISLVSPTTGAINFQTSVAHTNLQVSALTASSGFAGSVLITSTAATPTPLWSTGATVGGVFIATTASVPTWSTAAQSGGVFVATTASLPTWLAVGAQSAVLVVASSAAPAWTLNPAFNSSGLGGTLQTSAGGTGHQSSALTVANLSLGGGWSTAGTLAGFRGFDLAYSVQIVTSGIGAGAPTITATYGAIYATVPVTLYNLLNGTSAAAPANTTITQTSSGMTLTFPGFTPSTSVTYTLQVMTLG